MKGELKVVEDARSVLSEQVDELYQEINQQRAWEEDGHLEGIAELEGSGRQSGRTRRRRKTAWTPAPAVSKEEEEED